jgi:hypothetical protein
VPTFVAAPGLPTFGITGSAGKPANRQNRLGEEI